MFGPLFLLVLFIVGAFAQVQVHFIDVSGRGAKICAADEETLIRWENDFFQKPASSRFSAKYFPAEPECLWMMVKDDTGRSIGDFLDSAGSLK